MEQIEPAIHFRDVHYHVGRTEILRGVTGSFPSGKITTLAGPSGAGKSTLLKMCNGLISPSSGNIFIEGRPLGEFQSPALRRMAGIAMQSAPMIRGTVFDNLSLPLNLAGQELDEERAERLLTDVGLDPSFLSRSVRDLSGGQKQKVSIARTLVNEPKILLLDEITASLDPASSAEIEQLITRLNRQYEVTIIWITHQLRQAMAVGHYTWVLMDGKVAETGESSLLREPKTEAVKKFIEEGVL